VTNAGNESKKNHRDAARETARVAREAEKRRSRRNRFLLQGGIAVVVIAAAAIVAVIVASSSHTVAAVSAGSSPKNMQAGGIVFQGSGGVAVPASATAKSSSDTPTAAGTVTAAGTPHIVTYIDWSCPVCQQFEGVYASPLKALVASGKATLEIHPIAILDTHYQSSGYSTRAANAAACVANFEPTKFFAVQTQFYDHQPTEGTNGLTNAQMLSLIGDASATNANVTACVNKESYKAWVTSATQRVLNQSSLADPSSGGFGTPTVFVNGKRWGGTSNLLDDITAAS
jgi:protein-disulfide isomerase